VADEKESALARYLAGGGVPTSDGNNDRSKRLVGNAVICQLFRRA